MIRKLFGGGVLMSAGAVGDGGGGSGGGDEDGSGGEGGAGPLNPGSGLGAGGDPAAGGGHVAPSPGIPGDPNSPANIPDYAKEFADVEVQNWLANKGDRWPSLESVVKSHMDLEKLRGVPADQLLQLAPIDDEQAWHGDGGIFERLGRPKNAEQYDLPKFDAEMLAEGKAMDLTVPFRAAMFKAGASKGMAEQVASEVLGAMSEFDLNANTETHGNIQKDLGVLRLEWGTEYAANQEVAKRGARALGFDVDSEAGLTGQLFELEKVIGTRTFISKMFEIGSMLGEHGAGDFSGDGAGAGFMTPEAAQERIEQLNNDTAWTNRYLDGDAAARDEMNQLQKFANPPRPR